jgi:hypothetical protein
MRKKPSHQSSSWFDFIHINQWRGLYCHFPNKHAVTAAWTSNLPHQDHSLHLHQAIQLIRECRQTVRLFNFEPRGTFTGMRIQSEHYEWLRASMIVKMRGEVSVPRRREMDAWCVCVEIEGLRSSTCTSQLHVRHPRICPLLGFSERFRSLWVRLWWVGVGP